VKGLPMREKLEKLEKKIIERPADLKRHLAYADWLSENGDPKGKLIDLQIAMESSGLSREKRFELECDENELLQEHGREWLGVIAEYLLMHPEKPGSFEMKPGCSVWWWRGWIQGLQLDQLTLKLSKLLLQSKETKLFRKLVLTESVNASCDYLHEWGLLDHIKRIDLSYGRITDKGALTLAADRSLKKLDSVDLTGNQLTDEGLDALRKTFPKALLDDQNPIIIRRDDVEWETAKSKKK
jgi:uncharacterized protein (TIGR02996 family)